MSRQAAKRQDEEISFATSKKNMLKFKLVFVGDQAVGKSSIITRFIKNQFDPTHNPTVGIDFVSKNLNISGSAVRLQLWDTAGQQRFRSLIPGYLRDCQAAFIVFDLTHLQTYQAVHRWIDFVKQSRGDDSLIYIIGNKSDLQQSRVISAQQATQRSQQWGCKYFEVSAKNGNNLENLFKQVCADLLHINDKPAEQLSLQIQKSKLISTGVAVQGERQIGTKKKEKPQIDVKKSRLVNPKTQDPRRIKEKNCC